MGGAVQHAGHPPAAPLSGLSVVVASVRGMIIDCETCTQRAAACADCVVTFLTIPVRAPAPSPVPLGATADGSVPRTAAGAVELDAAEQHAIGVLAASGLVPPLRLVRAV